MDLFAFRRPCPVKYEVHLTGVKEGTAIEISISKKERKNNLQDCINNDHVWTDDDIIAIERGRAIINQWKIS